MYLGGVGFCKSDPYISFRLLTFETTFNAKINILYFLETLCDVAKRSGCQAYISMVQRDLKQIIDQVAPPGHQGTANVAQTRHVGPRITDQSIKLI